MVGFEHLKDDYPCPDFGIIFQELIYNSFHNYVVFLLKEVTSYVSLVPHFISSLFGNSMQEVSQVISIEIKLLP